MSAQAAITLDIRLGLALAVRHFQPDRGTRPPDQAVSERNPRYRFSRRQTPATGALCRRDAGDAPG